MRRLLYACVGLAALALSACGGGSSSSPTPVPSPSASAAAPAPVSTSFPAPATATSIPLPPFDGAIVTVQMAAGAPANDTITFTQSAPVKTTAGASFSSRHIASAPTGSTGILNVGLQVSQPTSLAAFAAFGVQFAGTGNSINGIAFNPTATYFLEIDDATGNPVGPNLGPASLTPLAFTATFTNGSSLKPMTLQPGTQYTAILYTMAAPVNVAAAAGQQVAGSPISHVIVITMENRTPDNLFSQTSIPGLPAGPYPGANIKALSTDPQFGNLPTIRTTGLEDARDPSHSFPALNAEWDNGKLDGFAADPVSSTPQGADPTYTFASVPSSETFVYQILANQYAFADAMFSSSMTPSFPGHLALVAGQTVAADDPPNFVWGCDETATDIVPSIGPNNTEIAGQFPCYDYQTIGDLMDAKGISWKYYTGLPKTIDGNIDAYGAIKHMRFGPDFGTKIVAPADIMTSDVLNCTLPSVSYINAPSFASDHSATFSAGGPGWVGDIYQQIMQTHIASNPACNYANNTAIIVTWDDAGGWADHVVPPVDPTNGNTLGFRVPLIVMSAFAQSGYTAAHPTGYMPFVSHKQHDYGSILRYIEENFGLKPGGLGTRDAQADDLMDMFNYAGAPVPPIGGILLQDFQRHVQSSHSSVHTPDGTPVDDDK